MATFQVTNTTSGTLNVCAENVAAGATNTVDVSILHQRPAEAQKLAEMVNDGDLIVTVPTYSADMMSMLDYQAVEWLYNILLDADYGPLLDYLDVDGGAAVAAAGGDIILVGRNLLQGQTFDTLTLWATTSAVVITASTPGDSGFTIEVTDTVTAGSEAVTKTANAFLIEIEAGVSTANQIATAINANAADSDGYLWATGGVGAVNTVVAVTPMAGGVGQFANNVVMVGGLAALPANTPGTTGVALWSDTGITLTTQAVGAATDVVAIEVTSNNAKSGTLSAVLA